MGNYLSLHAVNALPHKLTPAGPAGASPGAPPPANATAGFVETFGVGVCRGCYAAALRKEWHRWDKQFGSENDPVDIFGDGQLFVVSLVK